MRRGPGRFSSARFVRWAAKTTRLGTIVLPMRMGVNKYWYWPAIVRNCLSNVISHLIAPVIIHYAIAGALLFGGLVLLLFDDHLPLGRIANDTRARFKGWYWRTGDGLQIPCMM